LFTSLVSLLQGPSGRGHAKDKPSSIGPFHAE